MHIRHRHTQTFNKLKKSEDAQSIEINLVVLTIHLIVTLVTTLLYSSY